MGRPAAWPKPGAWIPLAAINIGFFACHVLRKQGLLASERWLITEDRTYPEFFGYVQAGALGLLFLALAVRWRQPVHAVLAMTFAAFVIDDAFAFHEAIGAAGGQTFAYVGPGSLRGHDVIELATLVLSAVAGGLAVVVSLRWSDGLARGDAVLALAGLGAIFFIAALVDSAHSIFAYHYVGVAEDWAEMLALSFVTAVLAPRLWARLPRVRR